MHELLDVKSSLGNRRDIPRKKTKWLLNG